MYLLPPFRERRRVQEKIPRVDSPTFKLPREFLPIKPEENIGLMRDFLRKHLPEVSQLK